MKIQKRDEMICRGKAFVKGNSMGMIGFFLIFFITLIYMCQKNVTVFAYDSYYYWTIADSVKENGVWDILQFPETFRGYLFPMLLLILKNASMSVFGNEYMLFRVFTALMLSCLLIVTMPYLFDKPIKDRKDCARIMIVYVVVLVFWGDFLHYPLSDLIAFEFLMAGTVFLKKLCQGEEIKWKEAIYGSCAGICFYAAYNTRAAFIYGVFGVLAVYIVLLLKERKRTFLILSGWAGVVAGVFICSVPQALINKQYVGSYIPKVHTEQYTNYQKGLEAQQVYWGLTYSSYMTYAGATDEYAEPSVRFIDEAGEKILEREKITGESFSYGDFFKLLLKYPQDMIGIYTRHLVSLMMPMYLETYIHNLYISKGFFLTFIMLLWFVSGMYFLCSIKNRRVNWTRTSVIFAIFIPCMLQLLGAPEVRFFLPIHFIMYFYILYYADVKECKAYVKGNGITLVVLFAVIYTLWISVVSDVLSSNEHETLLINDANIQAELGEDKAGS